MPIEYWFSTPIYVTMLNSNDIEVCHSELSIIIESYQDKLSNPWGDTVKTNFNYNGSNHVLNGTETNKIFTNKCNEFLHLLHNDSIIKIKESWFNISDKRDFQHFHIHDNYDVSGVYFFQTDGNDGDLVFNNPSLINRYHKLTANIEPKVNYKPETGKLILFPSFLEHGVFHNTSENKRISFAFNAKIYDTEKD